MAFGKRSVFSLLVVLVLLAGFFSLRPLFFGGLHSISGYDVAQTQGTCGGSTACVCGDSVTTSRTLDGTDNTTSCANIAGALIVSSHVIVDCNKTFVMGNGTANIGFKILDGATNVTIKNCVIDNFSSYGIAFTTSGNDTVLENNNISTLNSSVFSGIFVNGVVNNVTIINNRINATGAVGIEIKNAFNVTVFNNTIDTALYGIEIGLLSDPSTFVQNASISNDRYLHASHAILIANASSLVNITIRDELLNGSISGADLFFPDLGFTNVFINNSFAIALDRQVNISASNASFTYSHNGSVGIFLKTVQNGSANSFSRNITLWTSTNISFVENRTYADAYTYILMTRNKTGGFYFYNGTNLFKSMPFNSAGSASVKLNTSAAATTYSFGIDRIAPTYTMVSPASQDIVHASTDAIILLNFTTGENASCRYDQTDNIFSGLGSSFNSTTNFSHFANVDPPIGSSYTYYVKCQDLVGNQFNTTVNFTISPATIVSPAVVTPAEPGKAPSSQNSQSTFSSDSQSYTSGSSFGDSTNFTDNGSSYQTSLSAPSLSNKLSESVPFLAPFLTLFKSDSYLFVVMGILLLGIVLLLYFIFHTKAVLLPFVSGRSISAYYSSFVQMENTYFSGNMVKQREVLDTLSLFWQRLEQSWLRSATVFHYTSSTLQAEVIEGVKKSTIFVPVYSGVSLGSLGNNEEALQYLQAYFGTKDSFETIAKTLEFISGKKRSEILLYTPSLETRGQYPQRVAGFDYVNGKFRISASGLS
ncbi:right-handed parallel beta-helix repeat-containing protein [Candidatus Woesearchaeota archaeon]|nr:right-handed parallel beta-helix repeat-containing protein [Candidatus Woesearchaeota archaeon]